MDKPERLVIVGGGFAGVRCARELKRLRKNAQIDLFACENHMVFQPLLAEVAGATIICTIGNTQTDLVVGLGAEKQKGASSPSPTCA